MSLSGLDSAPVQDAYQVAVTEAGGWFLLNYTSRAAVELLAQGRNGVSEARNAITTYTETSPLFGLIMYRRRKILIKYIPDGTSRLLQARTAVHFSDIEDLYTPYETILEISTAAALNDTALAASIQLHTASRPSPSPLPTGSRLDEIREDGEDGSGGSDPPARSDTPTSMSSVQRYKNERRTKKAVERPKRSSSLLTPSDAPLAPSSLLTPPPTSATPPPTKPSMSHYLVHDESGRTSVTQLEPLSARESGIESRASTRSAESPAPRDILDSASQTTTGASVSTDATEMPSSPERINRERTSRIDKELPDLPSRESSSVDGRPSTSSKTVSVDDRSLKNSIDEDPYDIRKYDEWFKPKVRLGPRPVAAPEKSKRPATARVSALPASLKASKQKQDPPRPASSSMASTRSSQSMQSAQTLSTPTQPVVTNPQPFVPPAQPLLVPFKPLPPPIPADPEYQLRPTSRGSIKSTTSHRSTALTQDKLRLMKAIELRKRQIKQSQEQQNKLAASDPPKSDDASGPQGRKETSSKVQSTLQRTAQLAKDEDRTQSVKADSGIDIKPTKREDLKEAPVGAPSYQPSTTSTSQEPDITELNRPQPEVVRVETPVDAAIPTAVPEQQESESQTSLPEVSQPGPPGKEVYEPAIPDMDQAAEQSYETSKNEQATGIATEVENMSKEYVSPGLSHDSADGISSSESVTATERPASVQVEKESARVPIIMMADADDSEMVTSGNDIDDETTLLADPGSTGPDDDLSISSDSDAEPTSPRMQNGELARRRRGIVEPLDEEHPNSGNPDDFGSDDDDLLEELRSATFEEAQPIMVARSNLSNVPRRRPSADTLTSVRSVNITRTTTLERLASDASRPPVSPMSPTAEFADAMSRSRNVSSGISRRIQALAEISHRPNTPESSQPEQRERRPPPKVRPTSFRRQSSNRTVSPVSSHPSNDSAAALNVQHDPVTKRNSVTVSARIVRPEVLDQDTSEAPKLQRSDLIFNQGQTPNGRIPPPIDTSTLPSETSSPALSPLSPSPSVTSTEVRQLHSANRFGRHRQAVSPGKEPAPSRMMRNMSTTSLTSNDESVTSKDSGKTTRFFKRISNMSFTVGGGKRSKQASNPPSAAMSRTTSTTSVSTMRTITEPPSAKPLQKPAERMSVADMPPAVMVGDLNVQFPDSLLWKRRLVTVDGLGNLQFAIAQAMEIQKGVALKQFHLKDLRQPYTPDLDVQELANSLVIELHNGTSLQLACEDSMTQRQVLHLLKTYWTAWNSAA